MKAPVCRRQSSLFLPAARYEGAARHCVVLTHGQNPSTDYYIRPRCASMGEVSCEVVDITEANPAVQPIPEGTFVVIVRYVTRAWLRRLHRDRARLAGVAYFMDDDLPSTLLNRDLPFRYRYKILRLFLALRRGLSEVCSEIWVSTPYLAERYGLDSRFVIEPLPVAPTKNPASTLTYFYEGTASHRAEFEFLREVVQAVQERSLDLTFMCVGGVEIRRLFADVPRTLCIHPVSWPTYLQAFPNLRHDIGLAPLLNNRFNKARSHTKFFDITRVGAAGIYSDLPPYADFVRAGIDGLLLENRVTDWVAAILELANSPSRRSALVSQAQARVERCREEAHPLPSRAFD